MTSDKVPGSRLTSQDEEYEANVLDFLNKEIAATKPNQDQKTQVDDLDLLVSDLLKQAITESDQQQDSRNAAPEETNALFSSLLYGQEEAINPENKNSLPNLDLEFGSTPKVADPLGNESAKLQPVVDMPDAKASIPSNPPVPFPANPTEIGRNSSALKPVEASSQNHPSSSQAASIFKPCMALNRRIPLKTIAFICLLAVLGVVIYQFWNFHNGASNRESIQTYAAKPIVPASDNSVEPPPILPAGNNAVQQGVEPVSNKDNVGTQSPNSAAALPALNSSVTRTVTQASAIQPEVGVSKEKVAATTAVMSTNTISPLPAGEKKPELEKSSNAQSTYSGSPTKSEPAINPAIAPAPSNPPPQDSAAMKSPVQSIPASPLSPVQSIPASPLSPVQSVPASPLSPESMDLTSNSSVSASPKPLDLIPADLISKVNPSYPVLALRTRSSASVVVEIDIDQQGKVVKATPISGPDMFYHEAIKAVMKWRYKPASLRGTNVASQSRITIRFSLK